MTFAVELSRVVTDYPVAVESDAMCAPISDSAGCRRGNSVQPPMAVDRVAHRSEGAAAPVAHGGIGLSTSGSALATPTRIRLQSVEQPLSHDMMLQAIRRLCENLS